MIVYRLSKSRYSRDLSGKGAEIAGGRWNSKDRAMVYTSESRALCTAEIAVHTPLGLIPSNYDLISIEIPDQFIFDFDPSTLSKAWRVFPYPDETQTIGDDFLQQGLYLAMKVPSAVIQDEFNILANPDHPRIKEIKILSVEPFPFDERLFNK